MKLMLGTFMLYTKNNKHPDKALLQIKPESDKGEAVYSIAKHFRKDLASYSHVDRKSKFIYYSCLLKVI